MPRWPTLHDRAYNSTNEKQRAPSITSAETRQAYQYLKCRKQYSWASFWNVKPLSEWFPSFPIGCKMMIGWALHSWVFAAEGTQRLIPGTPDSIFGTETNALPFRTKFTRLFTDGNNAGYIPSAFLLGILPVWSSSFSTRGHRRCISSRLRIIILTVTYFQATTK